VSARHYDDAMYRDDVCAVCGESLPPDHLYCREHAAEVDERLHEIGERLPDLLTGLSRLALLVDGIAEETWDYVAEQEPDEPLWPPAPVVALVADADEVDIDVDSEPGYVRAQVRLPLPRLLAALAAGLDTDELRRLARACGTVEGASATH
jgi:hypothetical protein